MDERMLNFYEAFKEEYDKIGLEMGRAKYFYGTTGHPNFVLIGIKRQLKLIQANFDSGTPSLFGDICGVN
jgi:hypothetical protein